MRHKGQVVLLCSLGLLASGPTAKVALAQRGSSIAESERERTMTPWEQRVRVTVGKISLEIPAVLVKSGHAIDSAAAMFEGNGLSVTVDEGPFASRLDSYAGRPGVKEDIREIGGVKSRVVFFRDPDAHVNTLAIHVPAPRLMTVVIRADASVPEEIPRRILDSLQPLD
jgi:hypothetical protein